MSRLHINSFRGGCADIAARTVPRRSPEQLPSTAPRRSPEQLPSTAPRRSPEQLPSAAPRRSPEQLPSGCLGQAVLCIWQQCVFYWLLFPARPARLPAIAPQRRCLLCAATQWMQSCR